MRKVAVIVTLAAFLLPPAGGWLSGIEVNDRFPGAFSRLKIQPDRRVVSHPGDAAARPQASVECGTGHRGRVVDSVLIVAAGAAAAQDESELQRRRDVLRRRGIPAPAAAPEPSPPVEISPSVEPPMLETLPSPATQQKNFEEDNQELLKALKGGGRQ
jgi:hypothetical protein